MRSFTRTSDNFELGDTDEAMEKTSKTEHARSRLWLIRAVSFLAVFLIVFEMVSFVLHPKWTVSDHKGYARVTGFDDEASPLDVVFIGSSHMWDDVNPLMLFHSQGITSYDYGIQNQGILLSEAYVKHAIRSKHPAMIVLEGLYLYEPIHDLDEALRKWLVPIDFSLEKLDLINRVRETKERFGYDFEMGPLSSYMFPLLRYHSRWNELGREDFQPDVVMPFYHNVARYHGFAPLYAIYPDDFSAYYDQVVLDEEKVAAAKECFGRIAEMCAENGVELLLMKTPSQWWRQGYRELLASWAEEFGVPYFDMNDRIDEIGINGEKDLADVTHLNVTGAEKATLYLGQYLRENFDLPDHRGDPSYAAWEEDWENYQQDKASFYLSAETDWVSYVQRLQDPNYTIYMSAKDCLGGEQYAYLTRELENLGLTDGLDGAGRTGYLAVIDGGEVVYEHLEDVPLSYEVDINGHHAAMASESANNGNRSSICFDGTEYSLNRRGINILVYDNVLEDVVDAVTFDLLDGGKAYR